MGRSAIEVAEDKGHDDVAKFLKRVLKGKHGRSIEKY